MPYLQPHSGTVVPFVSQTQIDQHNGHDGPLFVPVNCHYGLKICALAAGVSLRFISG